MPALFEPGCRRMKRKGARRGATMKITAPGVKGAEPEVPVGHRLMIDRLPAQAAERPCAHGQGRGSCWEWDQKSLIVRWDSSNSSRQLQRIYGLLGANRSGS